MGEPKLEISYTDVTKSLEDLPTLPTIVYELTRIINDPMSSTKEVEEIMEKDMAITTRLLKLANSAFYSIPGGCTKISRAVAFLGFDTVSQLVMSASIIDALKAEDSENFNITEFWKHSIGVGMAAECISTELNHPMPSELFMAGLIHDMGKVALAVYDPDISEKVAKYAKSNNVTFFNAESTLGSPRHTEVGRLLAMKWKLPQHLIPALKFHHEADAKLRFGLDADQNRTADIVMLANLITHALKFGNSGYDKIENAPGELMGRLGLTAKDDFIKMAKSVKLTLAKSEDFISNLLGSS